MRKTQSKPAIDLPGMPLDVDIFQGNKLLRTVRLEDPRVAFCAAIESLEVGLTARHSEMVAGEKLEAEYAKRKKA